jgi:hypothetical protein
LAFGITNFTITAFAASTAVAVLAWAAALASAFTALGTFAACWALDTGLNAFGVALVAAFGAAFVTALTFRTLAALGAVTTTTTATPTAASAIGVAAITALAAFAWLFVAHGWLGFFFGVAAEQTSEPTPQAARFGFRCFGRRLSAACVCRRFRWCRRLWLMCGRRCIRQHTFDDRRLLICRFLGAACHGGRVFKLLGHFVAGFHAV